MNPATPTSPAAGDSSAAVRLVVSFYIKDTSESDVKTQICCAICT